MAHASAKARRRGGVKGASATGGEDDATSAACVNGLGVAPPREELDATRAMPPVSSSRRDIPPPETDQGGGWKVDPRGVWRAEKTTVFVPQFSSARPRRRSPGFHASTPHGCER